MVSPRPKALVMRKRSHYLSKAQHRQLRFMFAAVLAIPILAIGALVFMFPGIVNLGGEGCRKLLDHTWQNMKAEPLELTLFGLFALIGLLQSGYVLLARGRERLLVDEVGIRYTSPLPEFLQAFRPSWRLKWSQIRQAKVETSRMSPLFLVLTLDAGLVQRKIAPFQWAVTDDEPIGPTDPRKWRSLDTEAINTLLQLSPITQKLASAAIDLNLDAFRSSGSALFALEENPSTLIALVLFVGFFSYALIDGAFLMQETYAERPFYEFFAMMGILLSIIVGVWLLRAQIPRAESLTLATLVGAGFAVALYPGLLRINAISDPSGLQKYAYVLESNHIFKAVDAGHPALRFERDREYWAQFELGSIYHFELRKGGLGFYQLNMTPIYAAMKEFYRDRQAQIQKRTALT
jgi:hypothetical protein